MKTEMKTVTESDLLAYVDGLLDERRQAEVEAYLTSAPEDAEKVAGWRRQNEAVRQLFAHVSEEPLPRRLDVRMIAEKRGTTASDWRRLAAAAVLCLCVGSAGGWYGRALFGAEAASGPSLISEAVDAHSLYAGEVLHPVEVRASQEAHLSAWLSKRLDRPIDIPDLSGQGFSLVGGRLLPAGAKPAAQFMFEDKAGRRITLYIVAKTGGRETAFQYAVLDHLKAFYWRDATISCALIGSLPRQQLHELALTAYRQLS